MRSAQPYSLTPRLLACSGLLLVLCACTDRIAEVRPQAPLTQLHSNPLGVLPDGVSDRPLPERWWQLYRDPVLDQRVQQALLHNDNLGEAEANVEAMLAGIGEFDAQRWPATTVEMGAVYGRTHDDQTLAQATGQRASPQWEFNPGIELAYQVDIWGQVSNAIERARDQADAAQDTLDLVRINVAAQTTRAYIDQCAYGARISVARESLRTLDQSVALTDRQQQAGISTELDSARLRSLREQVRAELPMLDARRRMALYELAMLSGGQAISVQTNLCQTIPRLDEPLPSGDGWHLLERRPDIRKAERDVQAAAIEIDIVKADLYPKISFGASLTSSSHPLSELGDSRSVMFGIGPLISWQFPNIQANRARVSKAQALHSRQLAIFHGTVLAALKDVQQALALYDGERQRAQVLEVALQQSQRGFDLARENYRAGTIDTLDLLDSERDLIRVRALRIEAQGRLALSEVSVFKALGGNWQAHVGLVGTSSALSNPNAENSK